MAWTTHPGRALKALLALCALIALSGCSGDGADAGTEAPAAATASITVKVNYTRIPLLKDAAGVPTGLESDPAKFKLLPARGIQVRLWQGKDEPNPDGSKTRVWLAVQSMAADSTGTVLFKDVEKEVDHFVEVISTMPFTGLGSLRIIGDPAGIDSSLPSTERLVYSLRKGLDGSSPAGNPLPATRPTGDQTVTFDVGLSDRWWLGIPTAAQIANATLEPSGTGSRVIAIMDTAYGYNTSGIGISTPGSTLDLHYRPGLSHSRGSFIEYDSLRYPLSYGGDIQTFHYFGSIRGSASNDDAFDEGVILPLLARNGLWFGGVVRERPLGLPLTDLQPDIAMLEGLPYAMAAEYLKSPYLADTTPSGVIVQDVRNLGSSDRGPYSAPAISAVAWEVVLRANSLPVPGTPTDWEKINVLAAGRFFGLSASEDQSDRPNIFLQLAKLKEGKTSLEPVDLAAIFTDAVITTMCSPHAIPWPRPASGPMSSFVTSWGVDPNSLIGPLPPVALSMSQAQPVGAEFPNSSSGEAGYGRFTLTKDTAYNLRLVTIPGALPAGAKVRLRILSIDQTFDYEGSAGTARRIVLRGNKDAPTVHLIRVSLISPTTQIPDLTATVALDLAD